MLVLTRKLQETIKIGEDVTIHVLRVKGNTVRLGIEAPRQVRIVRGELETSPAESGKKEERRQLASGLSGFFPRDVKGIPFPMSLVDPEQGGMGS